MRWLWPWPLIRIFVRPFVRARAHPQPSSSTTQSIHELSGPQPHEGPANSQLQDYQDSKGIDKGQDSDAYDYFTSSSRWLYDDEQQRQVRYVHFNVQALKHVAALVVGAQNCTDMQKTHEGSFNRIFFLKFDNGAEIVAKLPTRLVVPPRLCTASEVATMDYARSVLGLPVPKVLAWSSDIAGNDVGVEYILMEKAEGVELHRCWRDLEGTAATKLIDKIVEFERRFSLRRFSQIGSLFYKDDVEPELQKRPLYAEGEPSDEGSDRFRIGPLVSFDVWRGSRTSLNVSRGPWPDTASFILGVAEIEKQWIANFAVPREPQDPFFRPFGGNDPSAYVNALDRFAMLTPHILPDSDLCAPVFWHEDMHQSNIMVKLVSGSKGNVEITAILDWQFLRIAPICLQATESDFIRTSTDRRIDVGQSLADEVKLPEDFDRLTEAEQKHVLNQRQLANRQKYYYAMVAFQNSLQFKSWTAPHVNEIRRSVVIASRAWLEGLYPLRDSFARIKDLWATITEGTPFPANHDVEEFEAHQAYYKNLKEYEEGVAVLVKRLDLDADGRVSADRFDLTMEMCNRLKQEWDKEKFGGPFPFQDGAYSWFINT